MDTIFILGVVLVLSCFIAAAARRKGCTSHDDEDWIDEIEELDALLEDDDF